MTEHLVDTKMELLQEQEWDESSVMTQLSERAKRADMTELLRENMEIQVEPHLLTWGHMKHPFLMIDSADVCSLRRKQPESCESMLSQEFRVDVHAGCEEISASAGGRRER